MIEQRDPIPAALYARVSSDKQDTDLSVSAQLRALRDYAQKNGYLVAREYVDEAESGRFANRPQFRKMIDATSRPNAPFREILVWKFSRFTRKREHAVAFKSMLRRKGIRVVSITEQADDTPTGKLMEAIIESLDEFYSENLAQEVMRGMREAASRGFWVGSSVPYGYVRVMVQDGGKKRPKLELDPARSVVVRRMFEMAAAGASTLDIARVLNSEGVGSSTGKLWSKAMVHYVLANEAYTGTLVWGTNAKDKAPPVRVEDAFPAIVSQEVFRHVADLMRSKAPAKVHPRRVASAYLLSGLVRCGSCGRALTGHTAKSGRFAYYICQSLVQRGREACDALRLNSKKFERLIIQQIRDNILTEDNVRRLVRMVDEEMDGQAREQQAKLESIDGELAEVRQRMDRLWNAVETSGLEVNDILPRIRQHQERQERLERAADEARAVLAGRRVGLDDAKTIAAFAQDMSRFLRESDFTERKSFIRSFVKEVVVDPEKATIRYTVPTPPDGPLQGLSTEEIVLNGAVLPTVRPGTPGETRTPAPGSGGRCSIR